MKRHISVFKTWFLLLANSCLKSRYSVVKCGYFKRCLLAQDMLLTSVRLWSTPIKTHNFNSSWINSLNHAGVFTFNAALLGSIRRAFCAAQASCYWFDYDGQSDIQFTRYQATTLSNLKRIYFNYLESRVWWKKIKTVAISTHGSAICSQFTQQQQHHGVLLLSSLFLCYNLYFPC